MPYVPVNGLDMYYEARGDGSPLLLLHGGSGSIPEKWIPFFTPRFRVIAPEQWPDSSSTRPVVNHSSYRWTSSCFMSCSYRTWRIAWPVMSAT